MPERDADLFKISFGQARQHGDVNVVVASAGACRSRPIFTSHSAIGCTAVIHLWVTEVRASQTEMILMG